MKLNKSDILEALGIGETGFTDWLVPGAIGFGVGALLGAGCALLFAPRSGAELRGALFERGRQMAERGREKLNEVSVDVSRSTEPRNY